MKKTVLLLLGLLLTMSSCDDGNFDVPAFEFTEDLYVCGSYVLYKLSASNTEAIVLTMGSGSFSMSPGQRTVNVGGNNSITYRIFSDGIGTDYFCQDIPPLEPQIMKELIASGGTIVIDTEAVENGGNITGYAHKIVVTDLLFSDGEERILFETFDFGTLVIDQ
jgi:hypothetical protein